MYGFIFFFWYINYQMILTHQKHMIKIEAEYLHICFEQYKLAAHYIFQGHIGFVENNRLDSSVI